ncbi:MAG: hypothetical protein KAJ18_08715, partial [Candidatus Omnitrophica bacterium]|nr:hypothetical protein [Candidatus Omnitrophota bacterium]
GKTLVVSRIAVSNPQLITSAPQIVSRTNLALPQTRTMDDLRMQALKVMPTGQVAKVFFGVSGVDPQSMVTHMAALKGTDAFDSMDKFRSQAHPDLVRAVTSSPVIQKRLTDMGGINLNAKMFDFKVKGDGSIKIPIALKPGQEMNFGGLEPVVIGIRPATADILPFES